MILLRVQSVAALRPNQGGVLRMPDYFLMVCVRYVDSGAANFAYVQRNGQGGGLCRKGRPTDQPLHTQATIAFEEVIWLIASKDA